MDRTHLWASTLGGPNEWKDGLRDNLVMFPRKINRGSLKIFENKIRGELAAGFTVCGATVLL